MEIIKGIEIIDLALWLKKEKVLIVSDFHLGYEGELEERGLLVPRFQLKDVLERLEKIFSKIEVEKVKVEKVVINGDLKHEYGKVLEQEWRDILKLFDFILARVKEVIVVKGNHDLFLGPIARKREIKVVKDYLREEVLVCHGDSIRKRKAKILIIGHEHPAIVLQEKGKREKYKCFLKGKFQGKNLIVMPSFNLLFEGTDVLKGELLSPYLKDVSGFSVYAVGKKIYNLGKVKELV